jgi:hyperosmotically inducible protein
VIPHVLPFVRAEPLGFAMSSQVFLKFAIAGMALASPLYAAEPSAERVADDVLTLRVQAAIADDPTLKLHHLNLLVNLVDGMAVIGGEVPDLALLPKVERVARNVPGVRAVKVSGWLPSDQSNANPYSQRLAEQLGTPKTPVAPKLGELGPPPLAILSKPVEPTIPEGNAVSRKPLTPGGLLMEPVVAGSSKNVSTPGAAPLPYPTIPPPGVPTQPIILPPGGSPWEELRRSDLRYAGLEALRSGRGYTVVGTAAKLAVAWEFAEKLQALPGVDAVVVGRIEVK